MARNKAVNLHDHLFEQLESLGDRSIKGDELNEEIKRAEAMCKVGMTIIQNGRLVIDACRMAEDTGMEILPDMLSSDIGGMKIMPKQIGFNKK